MTQFAQSILDDIIDVLSRLRLPGAKPDDLRDAANILRQSAGRLDEIANNMEHEYGR